MPGLHASLPPSSTIPPTPHSQLHHSLTLVTHPLGLIFFPTPSTPDVFVGPALLVQWGRDGGVVGLDRYVDKHKKGEERISVVGGGIAGLLRGFHNSFVILITSSTSVGELFTPSSTVFAVESLLAIPLDHLSARSVFAQYSTKHPGSSTDTEMESEVEGEVDGDSEADSAPMPIGMGGALTGRTVSESTIRPVPKRPFWRRSPFENRAATRSTSGGKGRKDKVKDVAETTLESLEPPVVGPTEEDLELVASRKELDQKVVRETLRELRGMYYGLNHDITHSLQHKHEIQVASRDGAAGGGGGLGEPLGHLPLWRRADTRFWFNAHLMSPFVEAGVHSYITVLMQGFVSQTTVSLPLQSDPTLSSLPATPLPAENSVILTLTILSRRSIERPGLRYQRRGTNVEGAVANFVESECVVRAEREGVVHVASFVQTRGSIPIFWSQSPWALKPPPVLERTTPESLAALTNHFVRQVKLYGKIVIVNLAEKTGKESVVVEAYRERVGEMGRNDVKYVDFDFHQECRGMRYENISKLTDSLEHDLSEMGYFWTTPTQIFSKQSGVVRTNCIDCLDRTNVVQSAISRSMLMSLLVNLGVTSQEQVGMHDELDLAFNGIWADNGDAISREYAGTSALKGDFTRTGKRDWRGAMNDASNSVARLLQSTVTDFFKQATIDYILGVNLHAFTEFQERLDTSDPGEILRLVKIRQVAIDTSTTSILTDGETRLCAWTLLSPKEGNVIRSSKYEEKILLLSNKAIYVVSYEFSLQKVSSFTRIPTGDITKVQKGTFILSSLDAVARDPVENYGFVIHYHPHSTLSRLNTYSMRNLEVPEVQEEGVKFFAFKALRRDMVRLGSEGRERLSVGRGEGGTGRDTVEEIVGRLREECEKIGAVEEGDESWVEDRVIVSLAEVQATTGIVDKLQRSLKALIWL